LSRPTDSATRPDECTESELTAPVVSATRINQGVQASSQTPTTFVPHQGLERRPVGCLPYTYHAILRGTEHVLLVAEPQAGDGAVVLQQRAQLKVLLEVVDPTSAKDNNIHIIQWLMLVFCRT
jgi:hypothetical protein